MADENKKKSIFLISITVFVLVMLALPWIINQLNLPKMAAYRKLDAGRLANFYVSFLMLNKPLPDSLYDLAKEGYMLHGGYICPGQPDREITLEDIAKGKADYIYIGTGYDPEASNPNANKIVIMHTKPDLLGKWVNFLFLDGHVEGVETSNPEKAAKEKGWIYNAEPSVSAEAK